MRVVLDTNVIVSGLIWGGVPRQLLDLARGNIITLYTSVVLLEELADVLSRDKFAKLLSSRELTANAIMQRYAMLARIINAPAITRTVPNDADDDFVLACALAAKADIIATGDSDLLILHPFMNIDIIKPAEALQKILSDS